MRHVLFVDDQAEVLAGFRRIMHGARATCRSTFVEDGETALGVFERDPVDVLVADMRMPGMDGATLLSRVQRRSPETVRMILSGYTDDDAALRSVAVAHRFLSKPCERAVLLSSVSSALELQGLLSRPDLHRLIGGLGTLPSAPSSFASITEALERPDAAVTSITEVLERDPACSAKLLQLVNSAFFGLAHSVTRVGDAVSYLGVSRVREVILAADVVDLFRCDSPGLAEIAEAVTAHSVAVATHASNRAPAATAPDSFAAGILHDVGRLALAKVIPEEYEEVERRCRDGMNRTAVEREQLGTCHAEVGAYLLRLWGLPQPLVDAVAGHHGRSVPANDPLTASLTGALTAAISLAGETEPAGAATARGGEDPGE
ncbi:MAG: HDOD domain-containing protein [Micromonosporaceae bacterium]|nr:HDOD domain-containing protein [Micromonosporaceae bacterium]